MDDEVSGQEDFFSYKQHPCLQIFSCSVLKVEQKNIIKSKIFVIRKRFLSTFWNRNPGIRSDEHGLFFIKKPPPTANNVDDQSRSGLKCV